jgi:two-component system LytT family response regulator
MGSQAAESAGNSAALRVLIVDDEPLARDNLRIALAQFLDVEVVGESIDGASAVNAIDELDPDVVLLDVQMPGLDGFGVIEKVGVSNMPTVVFVTAFDEHAVRAFQVHALDYILKPFDDARLREVIDRVREHQRDRRDGQRARKLAALLSTWSDEGASVNDGAGAQPGRQYITRLTVRSDDRIRYIACSDVDHFQADGNYINIHTKGETHRVRMAIGTLFDQLDPTRFIRIHRSTIVNLDSVREVQPWFGGDYIAIMNSGAKLRVSRARASALLKPTL